MKHQRQSECDLQEKKKKNTISILLASDDVHVLSPCNVFGGEDTNEPLQIQNFERQQD